MVIPGATMTPQHFTTASLPRPLGCPEACGGGWSNRAQKIADNDDQGGEGATPRRSYGGKMDNQQLVSMFKWINENAEKISLDRLIEINEVLGKILYYCRGYEDGRESTRTGQSPAGA